MGLFVNGFSGIHVKVVVILLGGDYFEAGLFVWNDWVSRWCLCRSLLN